MKLINFTFKQITFKNITKIITMILKHRNSISKNLIVYENKLDNEEIEKKWIVIVADNFHYMDQSEVWKRGEFENYNMALTVFMEIVDTFLYEYLPKCNSAEELYKYYKNFGDDPFIIPSNTENRFSAWTYAEARSRELIPNKKYI
jgi:hypothetical protein